LYVLISGRLQVVTADQTGHEQVIGEIGPGESVGEMHLLTGEARSATVYSIRDSELVQLSKASFDRLVAKHPHIMEHIAQQVIKRLQQTIQRSAGNRSNLALDIVVVPLHRSILLAEFSQRLAAALEKFGPTLVLDEDRFETELSQPGAAQVAEDHLTDLGLVIWLNQQATQYKFRLFQTNFSVTPWTKRCLRQADLVLLVGWAHDNPALSEIETILQEKDAEWGGVRKHLILLHQAGHHPPIGTRKWLNVRRLQHHYHLRWHQTADFERLARFVTGRAVGLVLGGGGVRGLAHLGVIRAIEELGLKIDLVGGSSFGAIIAGYYALEWDYETIYRSVKPRADRRALLDYTFPFLALSQGKKMNRQLKQVFGNSQIEDTWRPFFCTSSNLTTAEEVVHRQGPLWKYIRASSAVPPLFPPIIEGEMVLMDGGIMNNLPLDVMQPLTNGGPVIGVDVSVDKMMSEDLKFMTEISGWKILWRFLNPFTPAIKVPPLPHLITRVATLASTRRRALQHHLADLCIYPPVARFGEVEAEAIDDIIEVGYQTGRQALETWLAKSERE
jgi:predicted acylesterase/phospholipase RssA